MCSQTWLPTRTSLPAGEALARPALAGRQRGAPPLLWGSQVGEACCSSCRSDMWGFVHAGCLGRGGGLPECCCLQESCLAQ